MSTDDVARVARRAGARDVARSVTRTARCAVELVERAATLRGVRRRHGATTAGERAHGDEARAIARARGGTHRGRGGELRDCVRGHDWSFARKDVGHDGRLAIGREIVGRERG